MPVSEQAPPRAVSQAPSLSPAVFLALASGLTGAAVSRLRPARDPLDVAARFHSVVTARVPAPVLERVAELFLAASTPVEGAAAVLKDPEVGPVGESILKLWLHGVWLSPEAPATVDEVIPARAYQDSVVWRLMQASPLSQGEFAFGM